MIVLDDGRIILVPALLREGSRWSLPLDVIVEVILAIQARGARSRRIE